MQLQLPVVPPTIARSIACAVQAQLERIKGTEGLSKDTRAPHGRQWLKSRVNYAYTTQQVHVCSARWPHDAVEVKSTTHVIRLALRKCARRFEIVARSLK